MRPLRNSGERDEDYCLSGKTTEHSDNKIEGWKGYCLLMFKTIN